MPTYYDKIATGYNELHGEEQEKKMAIIRKALVLKKTDRLLDVGCGTGISSQYECEVYGIDPSIELLNQSLVPKERKKVASAERIPYPDHFFDVVVCISAVHNFKDVKQGLKEIKRVGKKRFVISVMKRSAKAREIITHIKKHFCIKRKIEEEKDMILFLGC